MQMRLGWDHFARAECCSSSSLSHRTSPSRHPINPPPHRHPYLSCPRHQLSRRTLKSSWTFQPLATPVSLSFCEKCWTFLARKRTDLQRIPSEETLSAFLHNLLHYSAEKVCIVIVKQILTLSFVLNTFWTEKVVFIKCLSLFLWPALVS